MICRVENDMRTGLFSECVWNISTAMQASDYVLNGVLSIKEILEDHRRCPIFNVLQRSQQMSHICNFHNTSTPPFPLFSDPVCFPLHPLNVPIEGKRMDGASRRLAEPWRDILCSVFPFHPWRPALYLLPLWAKQRQTERDGGMREKEAGGVAWNDLEMGAKRKQKDRERVGE